MQCKKALFGKTAPVSWRNYARWVADGSVGIPSPDPVDRTIIWDCNRSPRRFCKWRAAETHSLSGGPERDRVCVCGDRSHRGPRAGGDTTGIARSIPANHSAWQAHLFECAMSKRGGDRRFFCVTE